MMLMPLWGRSAAQARPPGQWSMAPAVGQIQPYQAAFQAADVQAARSCQPGEPGHPGRRPAEAARGSQGALVCRRPAPSYTARSSRRNSRRR